MEVIAGDANALGATAREKGVNFALFSAHAESVELCLFDPVTLQQSNAIKLPGCDDGVWHGFVPGASAGACYGYRVHGSFNPSAGQRFNAHKLLLDPYARQLAGAFRWHPSHFAYQRDGSPDQDLSFSTSDNSAYMPLAVVPDQSLRPMPARHPRTPMASSLLYEAHVRGLTQLYPALPDNERGRFAGMTQPQIIAYLKALGITAVQLLPVQAFVDEHALYERGLRNYWGYNTLAFFAPHPAYLSTADIMEFRRLVDSYHDAGIEVLLDVVYNHSCESDQLGPTLSMRGIDNQSYYRLQPDNPRFYVNDTGCGNTLAVDNPRVRQLVIDSLVYWVEHMGVDGFRFDLAPVLGRTADGFEPDGAFFQALRAEPALARCKLIAEPWDIGPGGYQLGGFPAPWSEWNDRYRDSVRRFWRGDAGELPELASRLQGSADVYESTQRLPAASINYVCSHDGFTLRDLVSYAERHNLANGEDNRDGHGENFSANNGKEGPAGDSAIDRFRRQQQRNVIALLAFSQGVPMLQAGDEIGRTMTGNNNAYCQDNPVNWLDWERGLADYGDLLEFTRRVFALRRQHPLLHADAYRHTDCASPAGCMLWFAEDGEPMQDTQWHDSERRVLGYLLRRIGPGEHTEELLVLINSGDADVQFQLPAPHDAEAGNWRAMLDTCSPEGLPKETCDGASASLHAHSLQVFFPKNDQAIAPAAA